MKKLVTILVRVGFSSFSYLLASVDADTDVDAISILCFVSKKSGSKF